MDERDQMRGLLRALGAGLGIDLEPDANDSCGLRVDDDLDITLRFEPSPPAILLYASVGELPAENGESVMRRLLEANRLWEGTRGATWSLEDVEVLLARLVPVGQVDAQVLAHEVAAFAEVALAGRHTLLAGSEINDRSAVIPDMIRA